MNLWLSSVIFSDFYVHYKRAYWTLNASKSCLKYIIFLLQLKAPFTGLSIKVNDTTCNHIFDLLGCALTVEERWYIFSMTYWRLKSYKTANDGHINLKKSEKIAKGSSFQLVIFVFFSDHFLGLLSWPVSTVNSVAPRNLLMTSWL